MTALKAEELRIGNLIAKLESSRIWNVIAIKQYDYIEVYGERTFDGGEISEFEGIQLTEDWLLKFGFEAKYKNTLFIISIQELHLKKLVLHRSHLDMNLWAIAFADYYTGHEKTDVFPTVVKYVHELQNLYFALTHTELTIIESNSLTVETKKG